MKVKREDLANIAKELLATIADAGVNSRAFVIALQGDLGAGKTTFTQALAKELGITEAIQSPTYVLMKDYPISFGHFKKLVHIDAYRLEKPEEFTALKPEMFLNNPENLVVIEWPERVEGQLPAPNIILKFAHTEDAAERYIEGI